MYWKSYIGSPIMQSSTFFIHNIKGYFSMRDKVNGSWFIQALCEVFITRAHLDSLDSMMSKVKAILIMKIYVFE